MPKISYETKNFRPAAVRNINQANAILAEYEEQGFNLTLRQLYYQFVARGLLANKQSEYKRLGGIVNDARLAGLVDWNHIVDRTRNLESVAHFSDPAEIMRTASESYRIDKWAEQATRVEVWIEKDALVGVIEGVCRDLDVPYFSCRGYTSQSEMWGAAQRLGSYIAAGADVVILHLGDHDPSGIDMTRDIRNRIGMFLDGGVTQGSDAWELLAATGVLEYGGGFSVQRIALNMDQVEQYGPPPNPAKMTDTRFNDYVINHGHESWELDALEPPVIAELIQSAVTNYRDHKSWAEAVALENQGRAHLAEVSHRWGEIEGLIGGRREN